MYTSRFDSWATNHHGLITRVVSGLSVDAWRRALRAGHLEELHPGVARLPGTTRTVAQRIAAAVLAAGPGALASHRSAAMLWGIDRPFDDEIDVTLVARHRCSRITGVHIHRPTDHAELVPQRRSNIPCSNILRTLCDLGAVDPDAVSRAVGHTLSSGLADLGALESSLAKHARPGRAGVRALRAAIDEWSIDAKPSDSMLETAMVRFIEHHRLPAVEFHPMICGWEVDFRIADTAILVECDGWTTHGLDRQQFERDRRRDDDLRAAGWIVMRLTYRAIVSRPSDTARRIRRAVDRWSALPAPSIERR
ncbi:MAG: DUF559 domain-containing protein [Acidimicrobiia bacterium]|nr:DUF559 domain-containing protein [Acidimicrobiia bacterium]